MHDRWQFARANDTSSEASGILRVAKDKCAGIIASLFACNAKSEMVIDRMLAAFSNVTLAVGKVALAVDKVTLAVAKIALACDNRILSLIKMVAFADFYAMRMDNLFLLRGKNDAFLTDVTTGADILRLIRDNFTVAQGKFT